MQLPLAGIAATEPKGIGYAAATGSRDHLTDGLTQIYISLYIYVYLKGDIYACTVSGAFRSIQQAAAKKYAAQAHADTDTRMRIHSYRQEKQTG